MTDPTRPDHKPRAILSERAHNSGEAIRITLQAVQGHVSRMENIADALAAENAALHAYVRSVEQQYIKALEDVTPHRRLKYPRVGPFRAEHNVAHLFDRDE